VIILGLLAVLCGVAMLGSFSQRPENT